MAKPKNLRNGTEVALNTRPRLRHGLFERSQTALKLRERSVRALVKKARTVMPWVTPADIPALRSWAEIEIVTSGMFAYIQTEGALLPNGNPRRVTNVYRQFKVAQLAYENALLMTPASRAAITRGGEYEQPIDVAKLASEIEDVPNTDGGEPQND
jgi:hypothetical protein